MAENKRTFYSDIWRKVFAGLMAVLAWWSVSNKLMSTHEISNVKVKIRFENNKNGENVYLKEEPTVSLIVNTKNPLEKLRSEDYVVEVMIPEFQLPDRPFKHFIRLNSDMVKHRLFLPKVVAVTPDNINVSCDVKYEKSVPVVVHETGILGEGFSAEKTLTPDIVRISGPSQILQNINYVNTENLPLTDDMVNFTSHLFIEAPNKDVSVKPGKVSVDVRIVSNNQMTEMTLKQLPVKIITTYPQVYSIKQTSELRINLKMHGPRRVLDAYKTKLPIPYIDMAEVLKEGIFHAPVHVADVPPGNNVEVIVEPSAVDVVVELIKSNVSAPKLTEEKESGSESAEKK